MNELCACADEEEDEAKPRVVTSKHVSIEVLVPGHAVGAVIGSQGSQIKQVIIDSFFLCLLQESET